MNKKLKTLSEFCSMPILRQDDVAQVIFDFDQGRPVRLIGFFTDADKSDFEIAEEAYHYYQKLMTSVNKLKDGEF